MHPEISKISKMKTNLNSQENAQLILLFTLLGENKYNNIRGWGTSRAGVIVNRRDREGLVTGLRLGLMQKSAKLE